MSGMAWDLWRAEARKLPDAELEPRADRSRVVRHRCTDCPDCAAWWVLEERAAAGTEGYRTKGGHFRTRPKQQKQQKDPQG